MEMYVEELDLGLSVLGTAQKAYAVDGVKWQDYLTAVISSSFKRAVSMDAQCDAMATAVRARIDKTERLGKAMAAIAQHVALLTDKKWDDNSNYLGEGGGADLRAARATLEFYGVDNYSFITTDGKLSKPNASKLQSTLKLALDKEDNALQSATASLQSAFTKRDKSYSNAATLMKKIQGTYNNTIRNIGMA